MKIKTMFLLASLAVLGILHAEIVIDPARAVISASKPNHEEPSGKTIRSSMKNVNDYKGNSDIERIEAAIRDRRGNVVVIPPDIGLDTGSKANVPFSTSRFRMSSPMRSMRSASPTVCRMPSSATW